MAIASNARLVANCSSNRLAKRNAHVLDGMVCINVQVTLCLDIQVNQPVPGNLVQHVVEKGHARIQRLLAGSVQVDRNTDAGFVGVASDLGSAHGRWQGLKW